MEDLNLRTVLTTIKVLAGLRIQPLCQPPDFKTLFDRFELSNYVFAVHYIILLGLLYVSLIARTRELESLTSALTAQRSNQLNYARE